MLLWKRELMKCDETYGAGSEKCGGAESIYCFDPTAGEVIGPRTAAKQKVNAKA
jgi:hypothetical protein